MLRHTGTVQIESDLIVLRNTRECDLDFVIDCILYEGAYESLIVM